MPESKTLKILFDGYWWVDGPFSNRQVLREFVFGWAREFPNDEIVVAVPRAAASRAEAELDGVANVVTTRLKPQGIVAILELPLLARRLEVDITVTHNFTPMHGRSAVFVHDLLFETNPEWFTRKERAYFSLMTLTMRWADVVLTSSASEARRIDEVGTAKRSVVPVGLGVPPGVIEAEPEMVQALRSAPSFALMVGRLNVRKNLGVALEAAIDTSTVTATSPVVVVGEQSGHELEWSARVQQAIRDRRVLFTGFVSDAQLAWLYGRASVFVFLSRGEGFGLPNLEALSFGVPIVASDIPVFRELVGNYATLVDPDDQQAASDAIERAMAGQEPLQPIDPGELGYSWPQCVRKLRAAVR